MTNTAACGYDFLIKVIDIKLYQENICIVLLKYCPLLFSEAFFSQKCKFISTTILNLRFFKLFKILLFRIQFQFLESSIFLFAIFSIFPSGNTPFLYPCFPREVRVHFIFALPRTRFTQIANHKHLYFRVSNERSMTSTCTPRAPQVMT